MGADLGWFLGMRRLLVLFVVLAALVMVPFVLWGGRFEDWMTAEWVGSAGRWAWAVGVVALVADLVLPVPSTAVISGLGFVYGTVVGGLVGGAGSFLAGAVAYGLCRVLGHRAAVAIAGGDGLAAGERLFRQGGGWMVALSRWLPLFPEVVACLAGLVAMPGWRFFPALACGSFPLGFAFAAIGATGSEDVALALVLSAVVPALLYGAGALLWRRHRRGPGAAG